MSILVEYRQKLRKLLVEHEGMELHPYRDTVGKLTIGVGRNLDDRGITTNEAFFLLDNDIEYFYSHLAIYDWFNKLDDARKVAMINMCFNLGLKGMLSFKKMISSLQRGDYAEASKEMLDSRWSTQVGQRAQRLASIMQTGVL